MSIAQRNVKTLRAGDRVHIRNEMRETLFTIGLGGTIKVASVYRAYIQFDDGTSNWVQNKYIFVGEVPEEMRTE